MIFVLKGFMDLVGGLSLHQNIEYALPEILIQR